MKACFAKHRMAILFWQFALCTLLKCFTRIKLLSVRVRRPNLQHHPKSILWLVGNL